MRRTQIYLDDYQYEMLRSRARQKGKSMASIIREILDDYLRGTGNPSRDPLLGVIGIGAGDGTAVAEHYEDFLYGKGR